MSENLDIITKSLTKIKRDYAELHKHFRTELEEKDREIERLKRSNNELSSMYYDEVMKGAIVERKFQLISRIINRKSEDNPASPQYLYLRAELKDINQRHEEKRGEQYWTR